jgi:hypothetical protein
MLWVGLLIAVIAAKFIILIVQNAADTVDLCSKASLCNILCDDSLEAKIWKEVEDDYAVKETIVQDFMGYDWKWRDLRAHKLDLAISIAMARKGKLPRQDIENGYSFYLIRNSYTLVDRMEMSEKFMLELEDELRFQGVNVTAVAKLPYKKSPTVSVRQFVKENGYGGYNNDVVFRFVFRDPD